MVKKAAAKAVIFCLLSTSTIVMSSCTGRGDLNNQGIVLITTIDKDEANGEYTVGVGILKPKVLSDESKIGNVWLSSFSDITLQGAARKLQSRSPVYPAWYSSRILLIGESAGRNGMNEIMDYVSRNREIRPTVRIVTVEGRAEDVLKVQTESSDNIAEQIIDILDEQSKQARIFFAEKADILANFYKEGTSLVMPRLMLIDPQPGRGEDSENKSPVIDNKSIAVSGCAVYQNNSLTGWLNEEETMGLLFLKGKADGGIISCINENERIASEIIKSNTQMKISDDGKIPGFNPEIEVYVKLVEYSSDSHINGQKLKEIEHGFQETVRRNIDAFFQKAYIQMKTDPALLGELLYKRRPQKWNSLKGDWNNLLPQLIIRPDIKVIVAKVGFINDTLEVK